MSNNNSNDLALNASIDEQLTGQRCAHTFRSGHGIGAVNGSYGGSMTILSYDADNNLGIVETWNGNVCFAFRVGEIVRAPASRGYGMEQLVEVFEIETIAVNGGIGGALGAKLAGKFIAPEKTFDVPSLPGLDEVYREALAGGQ